MVPFSSVFLANSRDLPAGRHRAGDRHLKFHDYRDNLAKGVWSAARSGEKAGKAYWNAETGIASGYKKGQMVAASISCTGGDPPPSSLKDQSVALVKLTLEKL